MLIEPLASLSPVAAPCAAVTIAALQVSCWFANARRRLKKENKMTWEPKNGLNDEDVDVSDEEEGDNSFTREEKPNALGECS